MTIKTVNDLVKQKHYNFFSTVVNKWIEAEYLGYYCLSGYCHFKSVNKRDSFIEDIHSSVIHKYVKELEENV